MYQGHHHALLRHLMMRRGSHHLQLGRHTTDLTSLPHRVSRACLRPVPLKVTMPPSRHPCFKLNRLEKQVKQPFHHRVSQQLISCIYIIYSTCCHGNHCVIAGAMATTVQALIDTQVCQCLKRFILICWCQDAYASNNLCPLYNF